MKAFFKPYHLKLKYPFGISGNTRTETPVVYLKIEEAACFGYGEASLPPYLGISQADVITVFETFNFSKYSLKEEYEKVWNDFKIHAATCPPALAAFDIACWDWKGKITNTPIWKSLNIDSSLMGFNAMTIGIDSPKVIEKKVFEASDFELLKIKIGSSNDRELINTIRKFTDKPIIADANQGIENKESALELCKWLFDNNCLLIEQPLKKQELNEHSWLSEHSPIPVIADESFQTENDLNNISNYFNGINIKLMKCGGITSGYTIAIEAKKRGLKILMGCMNESSCANLAAAQLAPLADWVDLDGPFLITNNPFSDFEMIDGKIQLTNHSGLGLVENGIEHLFA